ncbi:RNase H domain-containing protein [Trichonephila clavipes]|nr:RNase H domain-containing protein [Trichonephila clavipes]
MTSNVVHGCRSNPHVGPAIFSRAFSAQELDAAILCLNLNTSPGIHGQMISHLGPHGKTETFRPLKRLLEAGSSSSRLKKAIVVHIRKPGKDIASARNDIVLWSSGSDTVKVEESVNLADVWNFAVNHKLSLSPSKSTVGFFTTNRKLYNFRPRILLNSQPLEIEKHPRYLGFILDPEILSNRHLEHLTLRARKRIEILKYISSRDWGADAGTLRNTYVSLIRPILEYGFPIFCCSSDSNLQKLERVQLSAARIITGHRNSCSKDIVLYEADLHPLSLRRNVCLVKYYSKLSNPGFQNRTSKFLKSRGNVEHVVSGHLVASSTEHPSLSQIIDPSEGLDRVYFHVDLSIQVSKQKELPCYLKQLALERINVSKDAVHMFTDGSKLGCDCSGRDIYISFLDQEIKIQRSLARYFVPSLQFLGIHFQWIPSHVNITGNEIADSLARAGAGETTTPDAPITYLELFSKYEAKNNAIWMIPLLHPWYQSKYPGGSLVRGSSRGDPTALTRFLSGHLMSLTFADDIKHFGICPKCSSAQASPGHILSCLGLTRQNLVQDTLLVLDFFRVNGPDLALLISGMRNNNNTLLYNALLLVCKMYKHSCEDALFGCPSP